MFPVKIVDKEPVRRRIKVHYIGYGVKYDEWKNKTKIEVLDNYEPLTKETELTTPFQILKEHYSLFKDPGVKIKRALSCNRKTSAKAKIVMSLIFCCLMKFITNSSASKESGWNTTSGVCKPGHLMGTT